MGVITRGVAAIQFAYLDTDGTVLTPWRSLGLTDRDSAVTQVEADPTKDQIFSHELDVAIDIQYTPGDKPILLSLVEPTIEQTAILMGGTITGLGTAAVLALPDSRSPLEVAFRVLPRKGNIFTANHCMVWGKLNADFAKANKVVYDVVADVLASKKAGVPAETIGPVVSTIRGGMGTVTTFAAGSGYTVGVFTLVPLISANGESALGTVTVVGGAVTTVVVTTAGKNYHKGSLVTAPSLAGGAGFEGLLATIV